MFFTQNSIFRKISQNFCFLAICCIALRGKDVYENLSFRQKVIITPRARVKILTKVSRGFEKIFLIESDDILEKVISYKK